MEVLVIIYERHNNVTGLNRSMETQTTPFDNGISNDNTSSVTSVFILWPFLSVAQEESGTR
jgi:hypothetical protein